LLKPLQLADPEVVNVLLTDPSAGLLKGLERYVLPDPAKFFTVASNRTIQASATFTGSGPVVSGDGYIVTNAHLAAPDADSVRSALLKDAGEDLSKDIQAMLNDISGGYTFASFPGRRFDIVLSSDAKTKLTDGYIKFVAVLKVQASNLYTVPLGDDADATSGTRVFAIGYLGSATFASGAAKESQLEPSISSGSVSARKTVEAGYSVIQHNAAIQAGSSGGPMVDETGRIVGLTTAGNTGANAGTFYFSVPVTLVKEFLQRKNVQAGPSPATVQ